MMEQRLCVIAVQYEIKIVCRIDGTINAENGITA